MAARAMATKDMLDAMAGRMQRASPIILISFGKTNRTLEKSRFRKSLARFQRTPDTIKNINRLRTRVIMKQAMDLASSKPEKDPRRVAKYPVFPKNPVIMRYKPSMATTIAAALRI
jgi:hypothetical protein